MAIWMVALRDFGSDAEEIPAGRRFAVEAREEADRLVADGKARELAPGDRPRPGRRRTYHTTDRVAEKE